MKILVTGATGLIGKPLCHALVRAGHDIRAFARNVPRAVPHLPAGADLRRVPQSDAEWVALVEGCDAIINLVGEGVADGRWSERRKEKLRSSRVDTTTNLVTACASTHRRPTTLVNASAIGFYGPRGDAPVDESTTAGDCQMRSLETDDEETFCGTYASRPDVIAHADGDGEISSVDATSPEDTEDDGSTSSGGGSGCAGAGGLPASQLALSVLIVWLLSRRRCRAAARVPRAH